MRKETICGSKKLSLPSFRVATCNKKSRRRLSVEKIEVRYLKEWDWEQWGKAPLRRRGVRGGLGGVCPHLCARACRWTGTRYLGEVAAICNKSLFMVLKTLNKEWKRARLGLKVVAYLSRTPYRVALVIHTRYLCLDT